MHLLFSSIHFFSLIITADAYVNISYNIPILSEEKKENKKNPFLISKADDYM